MGKIIKRNLFPTLFGLFRNPFGRCPKLSKGKPKESKIFNVDLRQSPYYNNSEINKTKNIPKGKYAGRVNYYGCFSKDFTFEII